MLAGSGITAPLTKVMRVLLIVASGLVFLAGFQLFILTEQTDFYFAWTIQPPLTAAFLGAGYFASFLMEFLASREKNWSSARIAVPAVFAFTTLTLVATVLHLDRFHFGSPNPFANAAAWLWLGIYAFVTLAMLVAWIQQFRRDGSDSARKKPIPSFLLAVLGVQGLLMLITGVGLFTLPATFDAAWPCKLTLLTSRAVGAWLIGIGVFAIHSTIERDYVRIKAGVFSYLAFGLLEMVALARFPSNVNWSVLGASTYLVFIASIVIVGAYSAIRLR